MSTFAAILLVRFSSSIFSVDNNDRTRPSFSMSWGAFRVVAPGLQGQGGSSRTAVAAGR
ncbi:MAG: hypothetical protein U9N48_02325 [Euryarchaeota archaeon]|nr:hypothetical protein [Euryarchaeota archaeon]